MDHISGIKKKTHDHLNRHKKAFDPVQHYGELQTAQQ